MKDSGITDKLELVITARERDLGGFYVRRILPCSSHKMVGPFIFFDHMGPATFPPQHGVDVRPHPHIHLATVTYLFEGKIRHRDNLGSNQLIEPGAINWMTAGHGIVHSERTPDDLRVTGSALDGIQCWVALPEEYEEIAPSFNHYPATSLPEFNIGDVKLKLLLGKAFDFQSPVAIHSDLFYLDVQMQKGTHLSMPIKNRQSAVYIVHGKIRIEDQQIEQCNMAVVKQGMDIIFEAVENSRIMLLGGKPLGERYIYWNFVSSSQEKITQAKADWAQGPGEVNSRFPKIPGDDKDYIPLPDENVQQNPKGTIM